MRKPRHRKREREEGEDAIRSLVPVPGGINLDTRISGAAIASHFEASVRSGIYREIKLEIMLIPDSLYTYIYNTICILHVYIYITRRHDAFLTPKSIVVNEQLWHRVSSIIYT